MRLILIANVWNECILQGNYVYYVWVWCEKQKYWAGSYLGPSLLWGFS